MIGAILIVHVIVCITLILIVLLQSGKGADIGAAFGGTSTQTVFGSGGGSSFFSKSTVVVAALFMITCILLAYFSSKPATSSIMKKGGVTQAVPAQQVDSKKSGEQNTPAPGPAKTEAANKASKAQGSHSKAVEEKSKAASSATGNPAGK